jgi:hypothetical protein
MSETPVETKSHQKLSPEQAQGLHVATRVQLATYTSHKVVRAAKIKEIRFGYDEVRDRENR